MALLLDAVFGDPAGVPHPVRGFGWVIDRVDRLRRRDRRWDRTAGVLLALVLPVGVFVGSAFLLGLARLGGPGVRVGLEMALLSTVFSYRDLVREVRGVERHLRRGNLAASRACVGRIVGRDTRQLNRTEVCRAGVETVAEGLVDGMLAPLFWALVAGVPGALTYKAINTLDSMVGYRRPAYRAFGWASARLDDLANAIPARLVGILVPLAALFTGLGALASLRVFWRQRLDHPSPNAGHPEAAFAGALGCRLGGPARYHGAASDRPVLHPAGDRPTVEDLSRGVRLLAVCWGLAAVGAVGWVLL